MSDIEPVDFGMDVDIKMAETSADSMSAEDSEAYAKLDQEFMSSCCGVDAVVFVIRTKTKITRKF